MDRTIEFVFSIRSPFAWIASHHSLPMLDPRIEVRFVPLVPLPSFINFGNLPPGKSRYNVRDLLRVSAAYGLKVGRPPYDEDDWTISHRVCLFAERSGKAAPFAKGMMDARWHHGDSVSDEAVIARVAESAGLDGGEAVAASQDEALREELVELVQRNYDERGFFGVPMFVLEDGERFWGHDRMEWAIRHGLIPGAS